MTDREVVAATPAGKMWHEGEFVDDECYCDGADDAMYSCTFPPCVATREAEAAEWAAYFAAAPPAIVLEVGYDLADPKHPTFRERQFQRADEARADMRAGSLTLPIQP